MNNNFSAGQSWDISLHNHITIIVTVTSVEKEVPSLRNYVTIKLVLNIILYISKRQLDLT